MDKKSDALTSRRISEIYKISRGKANYILAGLASERRLARVEYNRAYFYGPGYLNKPIPEVIEPIRIYDEKMNIEANNMLSDFLDAIKKHLKSLPRWLKR